MRVAVVTTETLHHCHFVRELAKTCPPALVLVERNGGHPPFETHHPFEDERDDHERRVWFGGRHARLADFAETIEVDNANDAEAIERLAAVEPQAVIVFGAGKLSPPVIDLCPEGIVNLHGGDPERYRGLDTHLWAIYRGDFRDLVTTLHRVNARLDDGEVVARAPIPISRAMGLQELRSRNTEVCVELVRSALVRFRDAGVFTSRPQRQRGRHYSYMPGVLKGICRERFERHTEAPR